MQICMRKTIWILCCLLSVMVCILSFPHSALTAETDAEKALVEGAKKEGKVLWYTAITANEAAILLNKFHEKYPFIETEMYRGGSENVLVKILTEASMKRHAWDVVLETGAESEILNRKGLYAKYQSPHRKFYDEGSKDAEGFWTDFYMNLNVICYNTKLVSPQEVPKTYEDLLAPRWNGKMGMDTKAYEWYYYVLRQMGEKKGLEFMKKLGEQNIAFRTGRTLNVQMVAAGEINLSITTYNQRVEAMRAKGASINWTAIEPVIPEIHPVAVSAFAPHPNAARLLVDYLLSKEGQTVIASFYRIPSRTDVDPIIPTMKRGLKIMKPSFGMVDNYDKYTKLYRETLMRK